MRIGWPLRSRRPARRQLQAADAARACGDWVAAASALASAIDIAPDRPGLRVQLGHALKEAGNRQAAIDAYRAAIVQAPDDLDAHIHLGALLRDMNASNSAADVYSSVLAIDPDHAEALRALSELGGRSRMGTGSLSRSLIGRRLIAIDAERASLADRVEDWVVASAAPLAAYDLFRSTYPTPPPPLLAIRSAPIDIVVDATTCSPAMLRTTIDALLDSAVSPAGITVVAPQSLHAHPVASVDSGIVFVSEVPIVDKSVLFLGAGAIPDPQAIGWLVFTAARSGAAVVYGDHDRVEQAWPDGPIHDDPSLSGIFDRDVVAATDDLPPVVLMDAETWAAVRYGVGEVSTGEVIRRGMLRALTVVHVPRRLASLYRLTEPARGAPADAVIASPHCDEPAGTPPAEGPQPDLSGLSIAFARDVLGRRIGFTTPAGVASPTPIGVIVPTRDNPVMAAAMIESLRRTAAYPDRLRILVFDNGSQPPEIPGAQILPFAGAFNWSRVNNHGVAACDAPLLLFANDDMEMLSDGWDRVLDGHLARPDVGIVGARLAYPDGAYQHAGILFGVGRRALSDHEGIGQSNGIAGPGDRWMQTRAVSAVTGAFMAMSRSLFQSLNGFEERLAIAYNDIDMCLRVRERGGRVLYVPEIGLVHHESATRGHNRTRGQVAWDQSELAFLARRWGDALRVDPGYNPQWALRGVPFDGFREPAMSEVLRHIDMGKDPWRVYRIGGV